MTSVQCAPTYCILEPGSNKVAVGLKNILAKAITIPPRIVVSKLQQARVVSDDKASKLKHDLSGRRVLLKFRPTKFGGIRKLDSGAKAVSQKPTS